MDSLKNQLLYLSTMGIFLLTNILFSLCPISSFGQLSEHFSDGNLSKNPTWQGDVEKFIVTNNYLISNSETTNDIFYISTPSYALEKTQWNIKLSIDFKTSSANYIDIFLASDSSNPAKATQTYFIRLGGTKDEISLYNISDKYISLNTLQFKVYKNAQLSQKITLETSQAIGPKQYITLTTYSLLLKNDYPLAIQIQELPKIPEMNNTEGIISLYTSADHFMDSIHYHENQHFALLNDYDGVSLERINFGGKGHDPHQWHSASSEVGYATPGNKNSQFISDEEQKLEFNLSSKFVSPDGDGYEDYLALKYHLKALGYILNGYIYNLSGFLMHQPFNNISIGSHGLLKWDGVLNDGSKLPIGNYILQVEAFNSTGEVIRKKIAFGILGTF